MKYEGVKFFAVVEQSSGKHTNDIIIIVRLQFKLIAWKWIAKEYRKSIKIKREIEHETTFLLYQEK